mmetsp:Transcript_59379/g.193743  ORF Transcript_59379/g.193743 Transcript_59379/m.193743 type:complete len:693 (+) Transcript_59379:122-2200(+)
MARRVGLVLLASAAGALGAGETGSPIAKILQLLGDMQQKIIKEGEAVQSAYSEFAEWCEDRSRDINVALKNGKATTENLKATIDQQAAIISSRTARVEELAGSLSSDEADLKAATAVREKEAKDFGVEEAELVKSVDMLKRSSAIVEKEMKGGASMLQLKNADNVVKALEVMVRASLIQTADAARLTAFAQQETSADDADANADADTDTEGSLGAPAPEAYGSHSDAILETLEDLLDKAEGQLDDLRNKETKSLQNYEMMKAALDDQIKVSQKDMDGCKKDMAQAAEMKSTSEGDLDVTTKDMRGATKSKATLHHECMSKAEDFEAETKSRGEELGAIAGAKQAIQEVSGDASLSQLSFVQTRRAQSTTSGSNFQVVRIIRGLARKHGFAELSLLATKISSQMHLGGPFDKVKAMISDMLGKLEDAAGSDAKKKAHCDKEIAETTDKKEDKTDDLESLTTKLESSTAKSAQLKEELSVLQKEISALIKSQAEMDKMRSGEKATYEATRTELETSLDGIKKALKILNDYYGGSAEHATSGSSGGVIALLETVESDLSKNLAEITSEEESSVQNYKTTTNENQVEKATMEQDVKFKTKEAKELDKTASELTGDRGSLSDELDAVTEYFGRIQSDCSGKVDSYEETVRRRAAEIQGLKQALETLQSDASFIQQSSSRRTRRGALLRGSALTPSSA